MEKKEIKVKIKTSILQDAEKICSRSDTDLELFVGAAIATQVILMNKYTPEEITEIMGCTKEFKDWLNEPA